MLPKHSKKERRRRAQAVYQQFTPDVLDGYRQLTDPLADRAAVAIFGPDERGVVPDGHDDLLAACHELAAAGNEACAAYLDHAKQVPGWVDFDDHEIGRKMYTRNGMLSFLVGMKVLIDSYAGGSDNKVLMLSGRLSHDTAYRRTVETAKYVLDVLEPDGLRQNGIGLRSTQTVRLLHARVRQLCYRYDFDVESYDQPVNQEAMAGTNMLFSIGAIHALKQFGSYISQAEKESYHQLWRYVGYLMGVHEDLLLESYDEQAALFECMKRHSFIPDADTKILFEHTVGGMAQGARSMPIWLTLLGGSVLQSEQFISQFTAYAADRKVVEHLNVESSPLWRTTFNIGRRVNYVATRLQPFIPFSQRLAYESQSRIIQQVMAALIADDPVRFNNPGGPPSRPS